jgi:cell division septal protein FtsQ
METTMNRLQTITQNNKRNRVRDVVFACFIMLAAVLAVSTVTNAGSSTPITQR